MRDFVPFVPFDSTIWIPIRIFKNDKNSCSCISFYCQNGRYWYYSERVPFKLHKIKIFSSNRCQHSFFRMTGTQATYTNVVSMNHAPMRMWKLYHYQLFLMFQWPQPTWGGTLNWFLFNQQHLFSKETSKISFKTIATIYISPETPFKSLNTKAVII